MNHNILSKITDNWIKAYSQISGTTGLQICIRESGRPIFSKAYGYANTALKTELHENHLCHIASNSKMFTACGILMLQDRGALSLEDKLVHWVGALAHHKEPRFSDITIKDLLLHRGGLPANGSHSAFWEFDKPFPDKSQFLDEIVSSDLVYAPNTLTKYSNFGYGLLGLVIESASKRSFGQFMEDMIFSKLHDAKFLVDYEQDASTPHADGHMVLDGGRTILPLIHARTEALAPATGFCSNAMSVSHFVYELLFGKSLVSTGAQKLLQNCFYPFHNMQNESYGLGLIKVKSNGTTFVGHSGHYPGFSTQTFFETKNTLGMTLISNESTDVKSIALGLFTLMDGVKRNFQNADPTKIRVSEPLYAKWGGYIYAVADEVALEIPVTAAGSAAQFSVLHKNEGSGFVSSDKTGYQLVGEPIYFNFDNKGEIDTVNFSGIVLRQRKAFLHHLQQSILR